MDVVYWGWGVTAVVMLAFSIHGHRVMRELMWEVRQEEIRRATSHVARARAALPPSKPPPGPGGGSKGKSSKYRCYACYDSFEDMSSLLRHIEERALCPVCDMWHLAHSDCPPQFAREARKREWREQAVGAYRLEVPPPPPQVAWYCSLCDNGVPGAGPTFREAEGLYRHVRAVHRPEHSTYGEVQIRRAIRRAPDASLPHLGDIEDTTTDSHRAFPARNRLTPDD